MSCKLIVNYLETYVDRFTSSLTFLLSLIASLNFSINHGYSVDTHLLPDANNGLFFDKKKCNIKGF